MKKHVAEKLSLLSCPFALDLNKIEWKDVIEVLSTDDVENSVIVRMNKGEVFLVSVPKILYRAIMEAGEEHANYRDYGYDEMG